MNRSEVQCKRAWSRRKLPCPRTKQKKAIRMNSALQLALPGGAWTGKDYRDSTMCAADIVYEMGNERKS